MTDSSPWSVSGVGHLISLVDRERAAIADNLRLVTLQPCPSSGAVQALVVMGARRDALCTALHQPDTTAHGVLVDAARTHADQLARHGNHFDAIVHALRCELAESPGWKEQVRQGRDAIARAATAAERLAGALRELQACLLHEGEGLVPPGGACHLLPRARAVIRALAADTARTRELLLALNEELRLVVLDLLAVSPEPGAVLAFAEALAISPTSEVSRAYLPTLFARLNLGNGAEPTHRAWQTALPLLLGLLLLADDSPDMVGMLFVQALAARPPRDIRWQLDALICRLPPPWPGLCDESQTF